MFTHRNNHPSATKTTLALLSLAAIAFYLYRKHEQEKYSFRGWMYKIRNEILDHIEKTIDRIK